MEGERNWSDTTAYAKIRTRTEIADLPREIIEVIFLRLPVKTLLKLKCVSKWCLSLISSPKFVKAHLQLSNRNVDFTNHGVMFLSHHKGFWKFKPCSITSLMSKSPAVASDVDYPTKSRQYMFIRLVGSCNGIICIATGENDIFLWNPSTRKSKALPSVDVVQTMGRLNCRWGFGFSESEDDFKVVGIFGSLDDSQTIVKIYSLRTDSWKRIEDFTFGIPSEFAGKFASGKLHFARAYSLERWNIISLDLKSECYGIVNQPSGWDDSPKFSCLGTLGDCLSIISYSLEQERCIDVRCIDVWVMKEYGVKESWIKLASIPFPTHLCPFTPRCPVDLYPLLIRPNGEILLRIDKSIVIYNPKDNCFTYLQISNVDSLIKALVYVESLVPI